MIEGFKYEKCTRSTCTLEVRLADANNEYLENKSWRKFRLSFADHRLPMVAGDVVEPFENRKMNETVSVDYFQSWTMILTLKIG